MTRSLPEALLTNTARYLDAVNFATNFVFFRDDDHFATRLTTANYWAGYGARIGALLPSALRRDRRGAGGMGR